MSTFENMFNSILIIDDNEAIHKDFAKIFACRDSGSQLDELDAEMFGDSHTPSLERPEFKLQFASQGQEGLQVLENALEEGLQFGLAFVDMRMPPGWDGVETIEQLWKVDQDLQVVICTAYSDRSWDEVHERLGHTDRLLILKKPFDEIEVIQLATSLSEKRRLLEQTKLRVNELNAVVKTQKTELTDAHKDAEVLINSMTSVLISMDEAGIVSRWNHVAGSLFGIPVSKAIGQNFSELPIDWIDPSIVEMALCDCSVIQQRQIELQFVDNSGVTKFLNATFCPILNNARSKARLIVATDVTRQKMMQSQLDQALRLESVGQLAAGVAHEINTPIQYIGDNIRYVAKSLKKLEPLLECLHLIADPQMTDEQFGEIRCAITDLPKPSKIRSSLKQMPGALSDALTGVVSVSKIVSAMKEFSHPGTEQKSQVCVNHILKSAITVARNEWKYIADVEMDLDDELFKIDGLPSELNQAFLNIVVNASHAIGDLVAAKQIPKGLIRITTRSANDRAVVTIQDSGGGIPLHARTRVFEPFFTTKDVGKGTGQGLAVAYNVIANKHNGTIAFDVDEGVGTTFVIELPKNEVPQSKGQKAVPREKPLELAR